MNINYIYKKFINKNNRKLTPNLNKYKIKQIKFLNKEMMNIR